MAANSRILDDPTVYQRQDPGRMLDRIRGLRQQCQQAWEGALRFPLPAEYGEAKNVVILGMGGSAIGGDLATALVSGDCRVPIQVIREYELPAYVGPDTLAIASSYSGETEETLTAFRQARDAGARLLAFSTGGTLAALAREAGAPAWPIDYVAQPRATLGFGFLYVLGALQRLGLAGDRSAQVDEMLKVMDTVNGQIDETAPVDRNPAKQLANRLQGYFPIVYGGGVLSVVARRWKGQFNENAKTWGAFDVFPELNHNSIVGYQFPADLAGRVFVMLLQGASVHPRVRLRYGVTTELLEKAGVAHQTVEARGEAPLSQVMSLVLFGDYVSYYLALLNGVDPTPVDTIAFLKARLASP